MFQIVEELVTVGMSPSHPDLINPLLHIAESIPADVDVPDSCRKVWDYIEAAIEDRDANADVDDAAVATTAPKAPLARPRPIAPEPPPAPAAAPAPRAVAQSLRTKPPVEVETPELDSSAVIHERLRGRSIVLVSGEAREPARRALQSTLGQMPIFSSLFGGAMNGIGILAAGIVLAFMILPFIAAVMRDVFEIVPPVLRESAYGIGCSTWEVVRNIVLPYTQKGVIGGVMLGLGRALGETMAVTFVIGNSQRLGTSLFSPGTSIASTLANEFGEADDFHLSTLFALGFLLFVITFVVLALAKWMMARTEKSKGAKT